MSNFPLYTSLSSNLPKKDLTVAQKRKFLKKVGKMDADGCGLIYALIKFYYVEHEAGDNVINLPYNGHLSSDCINFDLMALPVPLRQILYKFVTVHSKKLEEDKTIQDMQTPI